MEAAALSAVDLALRIIQSLHSVYLSYKFVKTASVETIRSLSVSISLISVLRDLSPSIPVAHIYDAILRELLSVCFRSYDIHKRNWLFESAKFEQRLQLFEQNTQKLFSTAFDLIKLYPPSDTDFLLRFDRPAASFWRQVAGSTRSVSWGAFLHALKFSWMNTSMRDSHFDFLKHYLSGSRDLDPPIYIHGFLNFLTLFGPWTSAGTTFQSLLQRVQLQRDGSTDAPSERYYIRIAAGCGLTITWRGPGDQQNQCDRIRRRKEGDFPYLFVPSFDESSLTDNEKNFIQMLQSPPPQAAGSSSEVSRSAPPPYSFFIDAHHSQLVALSAPTLLGLIERMEKTNDLAPILPSNPPPPPGTYVPLTDDLPERPSSPTPQ